MAMTIEQWEELRRAPVRAADGIDLGTLREVLLDVQTQEPEWLVVETGAGERVALVVPAVGAQTAEGGVTVPYERELITDAPLVTGPRVSPEEEEHLYDHYGLERDTSTSDTGLPTPKQESTRMSTAPSRRTSKKKRAAYHVTPNEEGGWKTVREGVKEPVHTARLKADVVKRARRVAKSEEAQLIIHRSDGKITEERTYGHDPAESKG
jgi:sporulation protein YlmC with PRC-barrel domain